MYMIKWVIHWSMYFLKWYSKDNVVFFTPIGSNSIVRRLKPLLFGPNSCKKANHLFASLMLKVFMNRGSRLQSGE